MGRWSAIATSHVAVYNPQLARIDGSDLRRGAVAQSLTVEQAGPGWPEALGGAANTLADAAAHPCSPEMSWMTSGFAVTCSGFPRL
jgi:hypothetical protein